MKTWTPLWSTLTDSTVWRQSKEARILWITMLALKDQEGMVLMPVPALADRARLTIEETEGALKVLSSPEKYSRTQEHEGRRIQPIDGGWMVLNHFKYRDEIKLEMQRAYWRKKQAERRARKLGHKLKELESGLPYKPVNLAGDVPEEAA